MTKGERRRLKQALHQYQHGLCCYCERITELRPAGAHIGGAAPDNFATLEHLQRVTDGGSDEPDNLALACFRCNVTRGDMSWVEFKTKFVAQPTTSRAPE